MAHRSFVFGVRVRADAAVFRDFWDLADVWLSFGVAHAFIDDPHFARAQEWERIKQRLIADLCFDDGVEFHRDDFARYCDCAEDGAESEGGVLVPGGRGDCSARVGFVAGCEVTMR
jgi:hypothetical protein